MTRWHGLKDLVEDAVQHGTTAVEEVHQRVARKPLEILAIVPPLSGAARWVSTIQAASIATTYGSIRVVNRVVASIAGVVIDRVTSHGDKSA
jgi:hypothetical protein